jgi:hypothetical protein
MVAASLGFATIAEAGPGVSSTVVSGGKFGRAKLRTDGTLTVGGQETISLKGAPPKQRLRADISAPPTATECDQFATGFCLSEPLFPAAGSPALRSSAKGRATFTFVMPGAYEFLNFSDPIQSHPIVLVNGQTIHLDVYGVRVIRRPHETTKISAELASAIVVVEVPPAPSP